MTEFFEGHIWGKSTKYSTNQLIDDSFDLFIFTAGWERRCTRIIDFNSGNFSFKKSILLSFIIDGKKGWVDDYLNTIKKFLKNDKQIKKPINCLLESLTPSNRKNSITSLLNYIQDEYLSLKKPLKIGFDISSCPRVVFLQVLQFCIENDISENISFFYSEGDYGPYADTEEIFSHGEWETDVIPGFGKNHNISDKEYFIVSFGFEKKNYVGWIDECDRVSKVGVLFPYPGYQARYDVISKKKLTEFRDELNLNEEVFACYPATAGDAIEAWKNLDFLIKKKDNLNVTFLPYGPKPHSLAMGIRCLVNDRFMLTYRSTGYQQFDVKPLGPIWKYEVVNLVLLRSAIPSSNSIPPPPKLNPVRSHSIKKKLAKR